jgi:hypothetical protein
MVQPASLIANAAMGSVQCNNDSGVRNFSGQGKPGRDEERCPRWGLDEGSAAAKTTCPPTPLERRSLPTIRQRILFPDSAALGNCTPYGGTLPLPSVGLERRGEGQAGTHAPACSHCRDRAGAAASGSSGGTANARPSRGLASGLPGRAWQLPDPGRGAAVPVERQRGAWRHRRPRRPQAMRRC